MPGYHWAIMEAQLDPTKGTEQHGTSPVLIVSNEEFNQAMHNVTVLPITSTRRRLYPSEVFVPQGTAGLGRDSIIMAHQIRTVSKQRLGGFIGHIKELEMRRQVAEAIMEHLDIRSDMVELI